MKVQWHAKTLQELEGEDWGEPNHNTNLVIKCHNLRRVPLGDFGVEDLRLMIGQQISLPYLVPLALDILQDNPLAEGDAYPGDLLNSLRNLPDHFWNKHIKLKQRFNNVIELIPADKSE